MKALLILLCFSSIIVNAQSYQFEVKFKSKDTASYNSASPSDFLTAKAIDRKNKHQVGININDFPITENYLDSLATYFSIKAVSKWFNLSVVQTNDSLSIDSLKKFPFILSFKYIGKSQSSIARIKKNNEINQTNEIDYGSASTAINQLQGEHLHETSYLGNDVTIAVLDAGFPNVDNMEIFFPLFNEQRILAQKNFIFPENDVYEMNQHGTQVLSVLAGNKDGEYVGAAPNANYILLITEDVRYENLIEEYLWTQGAEYADSLGADIISSSLGYNTFDTQGFDHLHSELGQSKAMVSKAAGLAVEKGMLVVISAGNEGDEPWKHLLFPADDERVLTVGGIDSLGNYARFSSTAPATLSFVKPNVVALAEKISISNADGSYSDANGTSFACPIIAGLAACLWQALPGKSNFEIKALIEQSSHQYGSPDRLLGYGIPNFSKAKVLGMLNSNSTLNNVLFPNPTNGSQVTLRHRFNIDVTDVKLFDLTGMEISQVLFDKKDLTHTGISFPILSQGTYFLRFSTNVGVFQKHVILN